MVIESCIHLKFILESLFLLVHFFSNVTGDSAHAFDAVIRCGCEIIGILARNMD
jgi:hypothetical protein